MLDKKINALLFSHDCVIVPGLGGFVASASAAKHNTTQHTFIPPARIIAFNVFLRQNDGLLANFISTEEKISFSESMKTIERYVERCFMDLEAGQKVTVSEIGQLYYDKEKNIQFTPDETALHSFDAFGLVSLRAVPVEVKAKKEPLFLSPLRESAKKEKQPVESKRKLSGIYGGSRLVNAGLVVGVLLWAMFNVYIIAPRNFNLSALNPFEKTISDDRVRTVPEPEPAKHEVAPVKNTPAPPAVVQPANNEAAIVPAVKEEIHTENTTEKIKSEPAPVASVKTNTETNGKYFTVVGAFSVPSNAEKMLAKLREQGYADCGSIERDNKPTIVYAAQHAVKADALESLQHLKQQGIDAWILTR